MGFGVWVFLLGFFCLFGGVLFVWVFVCGVCFFFLEEVTRDENTMLLVFQKNNIPRKSSIVFPLPVLRSKNFFTLT